MLKHLALCALSTLALVVAAPAQATMTVSPGPLTVGNDATITYCDPDKANQTIVVDIDDGGDNSDQVSIVLDANGCGDTTWTVLSWTVAFFNAPDVPEISRSINP